jgi:hypothetical protein
MQAADAHLLPGPLGAALGGLLLVLQLATRNGGDELGRILLADSGGEGGLVMDHERVRAGGEHLDR